MFKKIAKWIDPLSNPNTTSGLDEVIGTFSLNNAQLYVGTIHTEDGQSHKVVNVQGALDEDGRCVGLCIFSTEDATRLVAFLSDALHGKLPVSFQFPCSETRLLITDKQATWTISKFVDEWHHGGGYQGKLDRFGGYIITKQSAERLIDCVSEFFGI